MFAAFRRILVTRMKFIGDVVLTTPLVRSLRNACPGASILYMGEKHAVSLLEHNPCITEIIPFDFSRSTIVEQPRVAFQLRQKKLDLVIDLFGNPRSALLTYLSGAPIRVGLDRRGRGQLYTVRVHDDGKPKTAIEFLNQFLRVLGIEPTSDRTEIFITEGERQAAKAYLHKVFREETGGKHDAPVIGIHPGATWPAKHWLAERFAQLVGMLRRDLGANVLLTAGPVDHEAVERVIRQCAARVAVLRNAPLRELAAVVEQCSVFVSNDAAPMHIAAAVGTPTIGLFGPGEENIWFPYRDAEGHRALRKEVPCHPCHLNTCNREVDGYMECMKLLSVSEVAEAVVSAMRVRGGVM